MAILDADKEGFLRSETSLIQTSGRAARNLAGRAIFYADQMTDSMRRTIAETARRRVQPGGLQRRARHRAGIDPEGHPQPAGRALGNLDYPKEIRPQLLEVAERAELPLAERIARLEKAMKEAAKRLEFEEAAELRDKLRGAARAAGLRGLSADGGRGDRDASERESVAERLRERIDGAARPAGHLPLPGRRRARRSTSARRSRCASGPASYLTRDARAPAGGDGRRGGRPRLSWSPPPSTRRCCSRTTSSRRASRATTSCCATTRPTPT